MITLFIDTHDFEVTLGLLQDEKIKKLKTISEKKDHSTVCVPLLLEILKETRTDIHEITDIVVVNGPGSFTGVRIGVTIAKTLAWSLNIPIRTITSLEMFISELGSDTIVALPEKNGFFVADWDYKNKEYHEYRYLNKSEYSELASNDKILIPTIINYEEVIKYAHKKDSINPHKVNPFYVKKIEVEK